ncbi:MAG TPA: MobC family plasmid mobilization relaxosome protein [candidate division WWE3 bacterium]|uniref:MobC family plasmid mobilization relaxosome protein n=1 Tax=candidate division WWE3 bacterium TaxID=2053526 RepID=A0A7V5J094_UNCKA|nr:MobC family plasmid mobilization relaxosome protein [candidate division WWE3 bacterium]
MTKKSEYLKKYREENKRKTKRVSVTLSLDEFKQLEQMAKVEKIKPTTLLKKLAFSSMNKKADFPLDVSADFGDLVHILRGVANNINQMAKHSNTIKRVADESRLFTLLKSIEDENRKFLESKMKS